MATHAEVFLSLIEQAQEGGTAAEKANRKILRDIARDVMREVTDTDNYEEALQYLRGAPEALQTIVSAFGRNDPSMLVSAMEDVLGSKMNSKMSVSAIKKALRDSSFYSDVIQPLSKPAPGVGLALR